MKLAQALLTLCCVLCFELWPVHAAPSHTVKGVVITPEGTVVPEFTVVVQPVTDKPQLVRRKRFTNGEFTLADLGPGKYDLRISAPLFVPTKVTVNFNAQSRDTDYSIVILHPYRSELRLAPGSAYSVSVRTLQEKIPDPARDAYKRGVALHREGKLDEAMIEYGRALRTYPQYIEPLTDIGSILLLYNRPESALTFLRRAQEVDDGNLVINLNIAIALTEQGDYGAALKLLKNVLHTEPRLALAQFLIARIEFIQKKYDEAEKYVMQAVENDPKLLDAWALMIKISVEQKHYDQAREGLQRIRETMDNRMVGKIIDEQLSMLGS